MTVTKNINKNEMIPIPWNGFFFNKARFSKRSIGLNPGIGLLAGSREDYALVVHWLPAHYEETHSS
ncbi:MAG TPA: hypothetical protein VFO70_12405 [Chitinophagaceae bacterium]|nr:hypothetical protein [Chitinophagaceae bacterium]